MSLEIFDDEVKRKHIQAGGAIRGTSIHEHASEQLLYAHRTIVDELPDGSTKTRKELDVDARTRYVSPANIAVLQYYGSNLDNTFGVGKGNGMRSIKDFYSINMISKDGKGRTEFTMVATASAINAQNTSSDDILKQVQKS